METKNNHIPIPDEKLLSGIKEMPEYTAPDDLVLNVMTRINTKPPSFWDKIVSLFNHQVYFSFSPVRALAVSLFLAAGIYMMAGHIPGLNSPGNKTPGEQGDSQRQMVSSTSQPSDVSSFDMGKQLLSIGAFEESIRYLEQAVNDDPFNAEYRFWLGVNFGNLKQYGKERKAYLKAVSLKPDHLMSRFYLGHNYMSESKWEDALHAYDMVFRMHPDFERALYNKGLALNNLEDPEGAIKAWEQYLARKSSGIWALKAVARLNAAGSYEYRIFQLGKKRVIFGPFNMNALENKIWISSSDITRLGRSLTENQMLELYIIVNHFNHAEEAKIQAVSIKNEILNAFPDIKPSRIRLSWFGEKENIPAGPRPASLERSVRFLGIEKETILKGVRT